MSTKRFDARQEAEVAGELEAILAGLTDSYHRLLTLVGDQRSALSRADGEEVERTAREQEITLEVIRGLESRRQVLVARVAREQSGSAGTITALAELLPPARASRIRDAAAALRELVARFQRESLSVRLATHHLLSHMEGLARQIARTFSHAGTYDARGAVTPSCAVVTSLDLRR